MNSPKSLIASLPLLCLALMGCPKPPTPPPTPTPPPPAIEVKITEPADGAPVEQVTTVRGTSRNVPPDRKIWVVVFLPKFGRYYPHNAPADVQSDGQWFSLCYIGQPNAKDAGLNAQIIAVLADSSVQTTFENYLRTARDRQDYPGLESIPPGASYDRKNVVRK